MVALVSRDRIRAPMSRVVVDSGQDFVILAHLDGPAGIDMAGKEAGPGLELCRLALSRGVRANLGALNILLCNLRMLSGCRLSK